MVSVSQVPRTHLLLLRRVEGSAQGRLLQLWTDQQGVLLRHPRQEVRSGGPHSLLLGLLIQHRASDSGEEPSLHPNFLVMGGRVKSLME